MSAAVVELVGPAGAGKSTLARCLRERADSVRGPMGLWGQSRLRLAAHGVRLLGTVARLARDPHPPALQEIVQMVRLRSLHQRLARERAKCRRTMILDEGPVFAHSWMDVFYPDRTGPRFMDWRQRDLARWARGLDLIVMVDAPDATLVSRLRTRAKPHPVKHASDGEIRKFLEDFRVAFGRVLTELRANGGPPVLTLVTMDEPIDCTAARLFAALQESVHGN